jgi:hypothetical protein
LTYDRRPKVAPEEIAKIHRRLFGLEEGKNLSELEAIVE